MSDSHVTLSAAAAQYLQERVSPHIQICHTDQAWPLAPFLDRAGVRVSDKKLQALSELVGAAKEHESLQTLELTADQCLVIAPLPELEERGLFSIALVPGNAVAARMLVLNGIESWALHSQLEASRAALRESALQLAQSFEEQNWLREFARTATNFSTVTAANEVAQGILQPLVYLLRAKDVFLIALPEETSRTGLVSANYGDSPFTVRTIAELLQQLGFGRNSPPLVRNDLSLETPEGLIHSIAGVVMSDSKANRGFLVAVNRTVEPAANGMPTHDLEFGSCEVGLLEEAAILLSTQTQNLYLLWQSNELFLGTLRAMSSAIDARDPYTQGHSERVARLAFELAQILGLSDEAAQEIYLSGILHDIGKIGIPDSVLLKPGKLSTEEFAVIKQHPEIGHRIVQRLGHLQFALPGILYHHEQWDGQGYPHGLAAASIPLMARIIAVADAFDAMTSSRPYRQAMPLERAHQIIQSGAGAQWDPEIVECFHQWVTHRNETIGTQHQTGGSIIPQDAPLDHLAQAVMTLIQ